MAKPKVLTEAQRLGKRLVMFEGIAATFNRRRAVEAEYAAYHERRGVKLRRKYRRP